MINRTPQPPRLTIFLADESRLLREALAALVRSEPDMICTGTADSLNRIADVLAAQPADLVLLDAGLPGGDLAAFVSHLSALPAPPRVVVLATRAQSALAASALQAGASGCLTREDGAGDFLAALRAVASGARHVSPGLLEDIALGLAEAPLAPSAHARLSGREAEVFSMLLAGRRGSEIAQSLGLSEKTVSTHKTKLLKKLGVANDAGLVLYAVRHRLVSP